MNKINEQLHDANHTEENKSEIFCGIIPSQLLTCRNLTNTSKLLYGIISGFAFNNRDCFASNTTLSEALCVSTRVISRCVSELEEFNYITVRRLPDNRRILILEKIVLRGRQKRPEGMTKTSIGIVKNGDIINNTNKEPKKEKKNNTSNEVLQKDLQPEIISDIENFDFLKSKDLAILSDNINQSIVTHRPEAKDSTEVAICQDFDDSVVPEAIKNMKKENSMMAMIKKATIFKDKNGNDCLMLLDGRFNTVANKNVFLSEVDRDNLKIFYGNLGLENYIGYAINYLNSYLAENPKKFKEYKNHYLVLTRWVKEKAQDQKIKDNNEERSNNYLDKSKIK